MNKNLIIISVLAMIFLSVMAFFGGRLTAKKASVGDRDAIYNQGWEAAKARFAKICTLSSGDVKNEKVKVLYGKILENKNGYLMIEANPIGLSGVSKSTVKVLVSGATQFKKVVMKEAQAYQQEEAAFKDKLGAATQNAEPAVVAPSRFKQDVIRQEALLAGQMISVTLTEGVLGNAKEATAAEVLADYQPIK